MLALGFFILVDDLQAVVVDVLLVQQVDVLALPAVLPQHLHMVALDLAGLFQNAVVGAGDAVLEKTLPLAVGKGVVVEQLQLAAQVGDQAALVVDGEAFIALGAQPPDEFLLQRGLALIALRLPRFRRVLRHHGALIGERDGVELSHSDKSSG